MGKPKQRRVCHVPGKKQQNSLLPDEEDWMVVKKQKITILIPPLPDKLPSTGPSVGVGHGQLQETPRQTKAQTPKRITSADSASNKAAHVVQLYREPTDVHVLHPSEPHCPCHRIASDNSPLRNSKGISRSSALKGNKGMMISGDGSTFLNQRMRGCHLERKVSRAGGLENWLVSLGLTCFVKIFERPRVSKFQLVNLTMERLKEMGTSAVGPRRKLMHAIDCICEPHCFQQR